MARNLVIVESPAKAKTIEKFLGKDFKVASSFGHIADLPSKELGVDVEGDFTAKYIVSSDKKKLVSELKNLAKKSETVWLASDEDREGEAIAWHLANTLELDESNSKRIVFSEITKNAILKAIDHPRTIDYNLVNAQQARRILDRLVGYELSPVLWRKVKGGLSAGRVQSVAVRLIVERERAIRNFQPTQSYKTQATFLTSKGKLIPSQLTKSFPESEEANAFLNQNINAEFTVQNITKKPAKKGPTAPFTTSTLQQEASRKLFFSVSKTMNIAQRLYEAGHITYMRTDSVNLSGEAQKQIATQIKTTYGEQYLQPRNFKTKNKGAQEAHEAIRPTNFTISHLDIDRDQSRLYDLIWRRTVASQMSEAQLERTQINIGANTHSEGFTAKGEVITFDGFLKLYLEGMDDQDEEENGMLPKVTEGEQLSLQKMVATQRFSRPPYRYSEASLVKKMEELGIGRPSTYAPTISTVQNRKYVEKGASEGEVRKYDQLTLEDNQINIQKLTEKVGADKGKLIPTDIGIIVNDFLVENFKDILDFNFTAEVEQSFDDIAKGGKDWTEMLKRFYDQFHSTVEHVKETAQRESGERVLGVDPKSGRPVKVRLGKFGPMAQIGDPDEEEKPIYASLGPNQQLESISFEEVMKLFEMPKTLGSFEEEEIVVNNGRFGPYIKHNSIFISLPKGMLPTEVDIDTAVHLIKEKQIADAPIYVFKDLPVTKGVGRFGPFLKWSGMFINVNKKYDFDNLSDTDIVTLIEEKIQKEKDKVIHDWSDAGVRVEKARWGRHHIIRGKQKVEIGKEVDASKLSLEDAEKYLGKPKAKPKKKATKKR
ncbi:type I DNA topoisomerase [Flavobacteriaceae bacterium]|nr:type I DNA topoisomerase [Flavobacteriaceae bacterium]MDA9015426.1 type I DNA topoisomerase [Flavobacteriaceae bacterium]MDC3354051.1 type I DNA topoisomerase [Flavobacteriaceae bacterium]